MAVFFGFKLNRTVFGKNTLAISGNPEASCLAGVNVSNMRIWIFALQGLLCADAVTGAHLLFVRRESLFAFVSFDDRIEGNSFCFEGGTTL